MNIQKLVGILLIAAGVCLGLYLGVWLCFVGGIVQIIEAFKATPVPALAVAVGILKVIGTGFVTWVTILVCGLIGGLVFATAD